MTDRSVRIRLLADISDFSAKMLAAGRTAQVELGKGLTVAEKQSAKLREVGNAAGMVGAAAAVGVGLAVKRFADFDSAMSGVEAATHASGNEMSRLRELAIQTGADTQFSATEAADGIEQLAKAGISTKDIMGGGLAGSLDLAAAGQIEVGEAAETAATALTQFNLQGADIPHVADLLAAGAGKAQGEVGDMSMALKQGGLVASQMGLSIEETVGTLSAFASAGLLGSDAGTSFKTMLQRLANPSDEAASQMEALGISAYDANGNFVGMSEVAGQLQKALTPLPQAQRDAAMATIFGADAVRAASVLYQQGSKGIDQWVNKVNDQGYAAETAAIKTDNLKGDLERLTGALDSFLISTGEGGSGPLRGLVQGLTGVLDVVNKLPGPVKSTGLAFGALVAATGGLAWVGTRALTGFTNMRTNLTTLRDEAKKAGSALTTMNKRAVFTNIGKGAALMGGLALASSDFGEKQGYANTASFALMGTIAGPWGAAIGGAVGLAMDAAGANNDLADAMDKANQVASGTPMAFAQQQGAIDELKKQIDGLTTYYDDKLGSLGSALIHPSAALSGITGGFGDIDEAEDQLYDLQQQLINNKVAVAEFASAVNGDDFSSTSAIMDELNNIDHVSSRLAPALDALGLTMDDLTRTSNNEDQWNANAEAVRAWLAAQESAPAKAHELSSAFGDLSDELESSADRAGTLSSALDDLLGTEMDQDEALVNWKRSLATLTGELRDNGHGLNVNTKSGQDNRDAIRERVTALTESIKADAKAGTNAAVLARKFRDGRDAILASGKAAGISRSQMSAYLTTLGFTPKLVKTIIQSTAMDAQKQVENFRRKVNELPPEVRTKIATPGAVDSKADVLKLQKQFDLTPDQVKTLMTLVNNASPEIRRVVNELIDAGMITANPTVDIVGIEGEIGSVDRLRSAISGLQDKTVTVTTYLREVRTYNASQNVGPLQAGDSHSADGNIFDYYGRGGVRRERHVAQFAPAGSMRVWAEPETGGEAYIPLAESKRSRSLDIWREVGDRLGVQFAEFAAGGITSMAEGGFVGGSGPITSDYLTSQLNLVPSLPNLERYTAAVRQLAEARKAVTREENQSAKARQRNRDFQQSKSDLADARSRVQAARQERSTRADILRQQVDIRDQERALASHKKGERLTGIDRRAAQAELAQARRELRSMRHSDERLERAQRNLREAARRRGRFGSEGEEAERLRRAEKQLQSAQEARTRSQQKLTEATSDYAEQQRSAIEAARQSSEALSGAGDIFGGAFASTTSAQRQVDTAIRDITEYGQLIGQLKSRGVHPWLLQQIAAKAESGDFKSANRLAKALLADPSALESLNVSAGQLSSVSTQVGAMTADPRFFSSRQWNAAAVAPKVVQVNVSADPSSWLNEVRRVVKHEVRAEMRTGAV